MTKIIGLTGGIGSGKTTVANEFLALGIPVYITDSEAKTIMQTDAVLDQIKTEFGNTIFENGVLIREKLSEIVFNNSDKLAKLNGIVHPAVKQHFKEWLVEHKNHPLVIYESAILFESGSYKQCDFVINVEAPLELRIQRVIERDKTTREKVLERIKNQWKDEEKSSKSDFVIKNTSIEAIKIEIVKILNFLRIKQINS
ncbi:dephospho-CoA kinase [Flavobacterium gilvum]|uniref:Dephospho-CoA kinase n=1 Tax=Flavobacterium gilvum TaxID=1492737 RepID=A0AAC9I585_9FLAO|nr:dephospho-CoA kinase [Flavobacterium gilvum]AOW10681.1 dephospho-CoA kinase [Flavobacterium gilvum]KFC60329.1 dephospho-CoA kinase [Flavobacterium gilvum]